MVSNIRKKHLSVFFTINKKALKTLVIHRLIIYFVKHSLTLIVIQTIQSKMRFYYVKHCRKSKQNYCRQARC